MRSPEVAKPGSAKTADAQMASGPPAGPSDPKSTLKAVGFYYVRTYQRAPDQFDSVVVAYRDKATGKIGLVVTLFVRDGVAVPAEYQPYPFGTGPTNYPFLSPTEAANAVREQLGEVAGQPSYVFFPNPASPRPMVFRYEFDTPRGPVYVSQDGSVWTDLDSLRSLAARSTHVR